MASYWMLLRLFNVVLLTLLSGRASAAASVSTSPSNDTTGLSSLRWLLTDSHDSAFPTGINLAPLTASLASLDSGEFQKLEAEGSLVITTPTSSNSVTASDICLISCDPSAYTGYLDAATTITDVTSLANGGPTAIILFSTQSEICNYTAGLVYSAVFSIVGASSAQGVVDFLDANSTSSSTNPTAAPLATISGNMSTITGATGFDGSSSSSSITGGTATTAVAMIILYTITGIITALFLGIIITGAVRAHRHPERYGPRNVTGRPRQSRARGIARAMLETIPIVKFGDNPDDHVAAAKRDVDVEMASRTEEAEEISIEAHTAEHAVRNAGDETATTATTTDEGTTADATVTTTTAVGVAADRASQTEQPEPDADVSPTKDAAEMGNNVCPICTEDFVKGQDVRLLPCSHQFHPECIDPWLINVSGTCPLCRINLNPTASSEGGQTQDHSREGEDNGTEGIERAETDTTGVESAARSNTTMATTTYQNTAGRSVAHRGLAGYMRDIRRARNAPVEERIEALRRLRQSNMNSNDANGDADAGVDADADAAQPEVGRRHLTTRLRDRFRIRTRQHGTPASDDAGPQQTLPCPQ